MATVFFDGYVEVQNNNVIAVYNNHNFNNNLLYPLQGSIVPPDPNEWGFTNIKIMCYTITLIEAVFGVIMIHMD